MKVIRTRVVVALASSALLASGFGLTVAVSSAGSAAVTIAGGSAPLVCPHATVIEAGKCVP
jgi:hypothetical protein